MNRMNVATNGSTVTVELSYVERHSFVVFLLTSVSTL